MLFINKACYLLFLLKKSGIFKDFSSMELLISADLLMPPIVRSGVVPACPGTVPVPAGRTGCFKPGEAAKLPSPDPGAAPTGCLLCREVGVMYLVLKALRVHGG